MFTSKQVQSDLIRKIENHMAAKGINRKEVAHALGLGQQAFKRRLDGEVPITVEEVWVIAAALRTAPSELLPDDATQVHAAA